MNYKITFLTILCCLAFLPFPAMGNQQGKAVTSPGTELKILRFREGKLVSECHYQKGLKHGRCVKFYEDGQKRTEVHYKAGKRDGVHLEWDARGKITFRVNWRAGRTHGAITE